MCGWGVPAELTKKAAGLLRPRPEVFVVRVSTILPTTGPAEIKVKTKAKGFGFEQGGGGSDVEHNVTFEVCFFCATPVARKMSIGILDNFERGIFFQNGLGLG